MARWAWLAVFVAVACSRTGLDVPPSGTWPPPRLPISADCAASFHAIEPCSGLRIVTPKRPIALDPTFIDDNWAELDAERNGGLELMSGSGLLAHLTLAGTPPIATLVSTTGLLPTQRRQLMGAATDGDLLFACSEGDLGLPVNDESVRDGTNALVGQFALAGSIEGFCWIGARDGLALTAYQAWSRASPASPLAPGAVVLSDAAGIRWSRGGVGSPFGAAAYGCGFAYAAAGDGAFSLPAIVTMLPLDEQPEVSTTLDVSWEGPLYPWPYDARTVALLTRPESAFAQTDPCPIRIDLVREDGSSTTKTFPHDCAFPIASDGQVPASLTMASFGAVLHDGAGNFQLLDASAEPVGDPVTIPLIPYISDVVAGAVGDFIVVLTAEDDQRGGNAIVVSQTVLACK